MKRALKTILITALTALLFSAAGIAVLTFLAWRDRPDDTVAYSKEDLQQWVLDAVTAHETNSTRHYEAEDGLAGTLDEDLSAYLDELAENSARYRYEISQVRYSVSQNASYLTAYIEPTYNDTPLSYEELAEVETPIEAVAYIETQFEQGRDELSFLCVGDWSEELLYEAISSAMNNTANNALYLSGCSYSLTDKLMEGAALAYVASEDPLDTAKLKERNAELAAEYEALAAEIREKNLSSERELYRAAAQAVADKTEYDDDARVSTLTDNRDEEEWINSSAYGALVTGSTICTGYALAYKGLCERLDLPCQVVTGNIEGVGHAWNVILLDGNIRYVDATAADTARDSSYFLMTEEQLKERGYYMPAERIAPW